MSKTMNIETTIQLERGENLFEVLIDGSYTPGAPDSYAEPGYNPEIEIRKVVRIDNGDEVELSLAEEKQALCAVELAYEEAA